MEAKVVIITTSGHEHEFIMTSEKALQLVQLITAPRNANDKAWVDIWDYTEAKVGQLMVNLNKIETVHVDPMQQ